MGKTKWTDEEINFIKDNYQSLTCKEIGIILNLNYSSIKHKVQLLGLKKGSGYWDRKNGDKYKCKTDYFKDLNSNSCYILGNIASDGHIDTNGRNRLVFGINKKDIQLLEFIRDEISPQSIITKPNRLDAISLGISSKILIQDLISLGLDNKKSGLKFIFNKIPKEYYYDFIRGFFDGDGCISYQKRFRHNKYKSVEAKVSFYNLDFELLKTIKDILGFGSIYKSNFCRCYMLENTNFNNIQCFYNNIYYNNKIFYLKRKKEKFEQFFKDKKEY